MLSLVERGQKTERIFYCQLMKMRPMNLPVLSEATHKDRGPFKVPLVYFHFYKAIRVNGETFPTKEIMNMFCNIPQQQPQENPTISDCKYNVNEAEGSLE